MLKVISWSRFVDLITVIWLVIFILRFFTSPALSDALEIANIAILSVFVADLGVSYRKARSISVFFRKHWFDILMVIPYFRIFRIARILRLARFIRIARAVKVIRMTKTLRIAKTGRMAKVVRATKASKWKKLDKTLGIVHEIGGLLRTIKSRFIIMARNWVDTIFEKLRGIGQKVFGKLKWITQKFVPHVENPKALGNRLSTAVLFFLFGLVLLGIRVNQVEIWEGIAIPTPDKLNYSLVGLAFLISLFNITLFLIGISNESNASRIENKLTNRLTTLSIVYLTLFFLAEFSVFFVGLLKGINSIQRADLHTPLLISGFIFIILILYMHLLRASNIRKR